MSEIITGLDQLARAIGWFLIGCLILGCALAVTVHIVEYVRQRLRDRRCDKEWRKFKQTQAYKAMMGDYQMSDEQAAELKEKLAVHHYDSVDELLRSL